MDLKVVIGDPKTGRSLQKVLSEESAKPLFGKKIGETVKGELFDLSGYEFIISGGSDLAGFPMRKDLPGTGRKRILTTHSRGVHIREKGVRIRKSVAGNTIFANTAQINLKVTKEGTSTLFTEEMLAAAKEKKKDKKGAK